MSSWARGHDYQNLTLELLLIKQLKVYVQVMLTLEPLLIFYLEILLAV